MHQTFRVLGQQMGMQLVRAILPEEIDVYLNTAIVEKVREHILSNAVTAFQDRVSVQDNPTSPINYIRTLYIRKEVSNQNNGGFSLAIFDVMFYTSFSIKYENDNNIYACRLIEPDKINETLRDYCNGASYDYPICTLINDTAYGEVLQVYTNDTTKTIEKVIVNYIKNPAKVNYSTPVNCDLPEYTHNDIVQLAVQKYFASVGSTTHNVNQ